MQEVYRTDKVALGGLTPDAAAAAETLTATASYGGAVAYRSEPCIVVYGVPVWIMPNGKVRVGEPNAPLVEAAEAAAEIRARNQQAGASTKEVT